MPCRSTSFHPLRATCAALAAGLLAAAAHAAPKPLNDDEMSAVRGADGSILAGLQGSSSGSQNNLSTGLAAAFASSTPPSALNAAEFASQLAQRGLSLSMMPGYDGQTVMQTVVDARPVTFSFDLSDVLRSTTGLQYSGPSMGTITMTNFDARGTTLWVWQHH